MLPVRKTPTKTHAPTPTRPAFRLYFTKPQVTCPHSRPLLLVQSITLLIAWLIFTHPKAKWAYSRSLWFKFNCFRYLWKTGLHYSWKLEILFVIYFFSIAWTFIISLAAWNVNIKFTVTPLVVFIEWTGLFWLSGLHTALIGADKHIVMRLGETHLFTMMIGGCW